MNYVIYKITNKINNKYYIGTHKTLDINDNYFGSGTLLKRAIKKYGIENFSKEILFIFNNEDDMFNKEREIVNEDFCKSKDTYNIGLGGSGGSRIEKDHHTHSEEHMRSMSEKAKLSWKNSEIYKRRVEKLITQTKQLHLEGKLSAPNWSGKVHSGETKNKISASKKQKYTGEENSQYGTMWITDGSINKKIKKDEKIPFGWIKGRTMKPQIY